MNRRFFQTALWMALAMTASLCQAAPMGFKDS